MKTKLYFLGFLLTVLAIFVTFFSQSPTLLSPLCTSSAEAPEKCLQTRSRLGDASTDKKKISKPYIVMGFAPYWNLKKLNPESLVNITHFAYFNLLLNKDGTIFTKVNKREEDPAYTNYKRLVAGNVNRGSKPLIIAFMPESQSALQEIVGSKIAREKTIETIAQILNESGATGVNIDFEPVGDTPPSVKDNFTIFIKELRTKLPASQLSISIYASSAVRPRLWDLKSLESHTDYFVVMTYDYTMPGSNISGPNSPLRGSGDIIEHDIIKNIAEITKQIPPSKILLGIPFYGYEWDTVDTTKYAPSLARGSLASLERIQQMIDNKTFELIWDRNSLTPYGVASESGKISQIYIENETSIRLKLEFVKSANLGGIAIWALGYEGNSSWIWPIIANLNH